MNVLQQIPDFILAPSYVYLLIRIKTSHDDFFRSTFFKFFISAGICSLCSTVPFVIFSLIVFPVSIVWLYWILWIVNAIGALGSTACKFFMSLHRYFVLRDITIWSNKLVNSLIASIFIILLVINTPVAFLGYVSRLHEGQEVVLTTSPTGTLLSKIYSSSTYIFYCSATIILTILTSRHLSKLSKLVQVGNTKKEILKKQKIIFIVVACCTISHCLKCAHQILWSYLVFSNTLTTATYDNFIFPMETPDNSGNRFESCVKHKLERDFIQQYILTNALANYTAPITLVIVSRKVRMLLLCRKENVADESTRSQNGTASLSSRRY